MKTNKGVSNNYNEEELVLDSIYRPKNASVTKRLAAFILDFITVIIIAVGISLLTSVITNYDATMKALDEKYIQYNIKSYDEDGNLITTKGSDDELAIYWYNFEQDKEACDLWDEMVDKTSAIPLVGFSVTILIVELIMPLILKEGRTLGMFLFKIALVTKDQIRVKFKNVFIRFLFGKWLVNGVLPIICVLMIYFNRANIFIIITLFTVLFSNLGPYFVNERKIFLPDYFGGTFACDMEEQMFFDTIEELNKAKGEEAAKLMKSRKKYY